MLGGTASAGGRHMSKAEGVKVPTVTKRIDETYGMLCGNIVLKSFWKKELLGA